MASKLRGESGQSWPATFRRPLNAPAAGPVWIIGGLNGVHRDRLAAFCVGIFVANLAREQKQHTSCLMKGRPFAHFRPSKCSQMSSLRVGPTNRAQSVCEACPLARSLARLLAGQSTQTGSIRQPKTAPRSQNKAHSAGKYFALKQAESAIMTSSSSYTDPNLPTGNFSLSLSSYPCLWPRPPTNH